VITALLLVACLAMAQIAPLLTARAAMGAVATSENGSGFRWATAAMGISLVGSIALFGVVAIIAIWRLIKSRAAIGTAVTGCVLQVVLLLITVMMTGLAR
jgi:hypothetical protein